MQGVASAGKFLRHQTPGVKIPGNTYFQLQAPTFCFRPIYLVHPYPGRNSCRVKIMVFIITTNHLRLNMRKIIKIIFSKKLCWSAGHFKMVKLKTSTPSGRVSSWRQPIKFIYLRSPRGLHWTWFFSELSVISTLESSLVSAAGAWFFGRAREADCACGWSAAPTSAHSPAFRCPPRWTGAKQAA